jgi:hypothetical protein
MDNYTIVGGSLGIASMVISVLTYINHKRIRSVCCGRTIEASLDVENTTPVAIPVSTEK